MILKRASLEKIEKIIKPTLTKSLELLFMMLKIICQQKVNKIQKKILNRSLLIQSQFSTKSFLKINLTNIYIPNSILVHALSSVSKQIHQT
ncbi:hypothetical protein BpHYR1_020790 [Brachionus plicatilis]|uniref:Uncharacterized protein n=1 Tax=Brachionus plicatilis TaxID=10195 RepID=A0A3M7S7N6_BRAPC|nr:hypothetical protein BpHYR1_020790 [Brachionus plicatilis]